MARAGTLSTVLTGVFVAILDFFIVNVAIPTTQRDLHAGPAAIEWVVAGYALAYGSGLVLGGRLGDVFGRRRMFALGLALFTLASVACGLAPDAGSLVAARIVQGATAAVLAPQVLAATWRVIPESRAAGAVRLDLGAGMGLVLSPVMGTVLSRVAPHHAGGAAGALTTAQQVGGALGVGIIGIVFYNALSGGVTVAFQHGLVYLIVITLAIAALVQWLPRARAAA
ncbi:MFS transporter [Microbispora hainanensis]|uniref:MFS transporter n=1 Tax=Microbispora hainanensis TaxID=568844 RepID=UPI003408094B